MLDSLHRRRRGWLAAQILSLVTGGRVPAGPRPRDLRAAFEQELRATQRMTDRQLEPPRPTLADAKEMRVDVASALAARTSPTYGPDRLGTPSRELLERLDKDDVEQVVARLDGDLRATWDAAAEADRQRLTLIFAAYYGVTSVLEKTGLSADMPPDSVHAMARGPYASGGSPWLAELIVGAVERAGRKVPRGAVGLDFGCSSGRVVRVLQAWRPDVRWLGCDPNARAVAWAVEHLRGVKFFSSGSRPPLPLEPGSLDLAYAISIWSHFGAAPAVAWLEEMRRVLKPGGLFVLTTHGWTSVKRYLEAGPDPAALRACVQSLVGTGHWFQEVFGPSGDWGVVDEEWGMAYLTPDWLLSRALPGWSVLLYEPARLEGNQDLYVLERQGDPL